MHERAAEFAERAREEYGVEVDVHEFDEGTKTAADAADAIGCDVAQIASSIVVVADDTPVVVITSGANRVDLEKVAVYADAADARMAEADEVKNATGWSIGGVPPVCHENGAPVLLDETLLSHDEVWAAAGTPTAVWPIDPERLVELAGAEAADVAE
ncbi:YbaK/EbsC family protein [Halobacterium litoreum]|uniref:YbaK/EbsC family protein n=1 Tax=Halobacterium litoreum TaxID=2039234 RepID=A0ABD5NFY7_9EURY|nr:YbaK/EbsC family protein [Halobacterium litoreum]UHH13003.1 YbaK/EbsC family protein [Halobacterium litoreum]